MPHNLKTNLLLMALCLVSAIRVSAQCTTQYTDSYLDSAGVHSSVVLTDNIINIGSNCASGVGSGAVHTYATSVRIESPTGRVVTGTGGGSMPRGYTSGYSSASTVLPLPPYDGLDSD